MGLAVASGMQRVGVASCVKHFPGHGDTNADSHTQLPVVDLGLLYIPTNMSFVNFIRFSNYLIIIITSQRVYPRKGIFSCGK